MEFNPSWFNYSCTKIWKRKEKLKKRKLRIKLNNPNRNLHIENIRIMENIMEYSISSKVRSWIIIFCFLIDFRFLSRKIYHRDTHKGSLPISLIETFNVKGVPRFQIQIKRITWEKFDADGLQNRLSLVTLSRDD